jgi:hypothetical protein
MDYNRFYHNITHVCAYHLPMIRRGALNHIDNAEEIQIYSDFRERRISSTTAVRGSLSS